MCKKITRLQEEPPKLEDLERELHRGAKDTIIKQEEFVKKQFEQDCFKQFEMETLINWENFINNTKQRYSKLLTDCYEAQFHFKKKVDEYENAILQKLRHSYGEKPKALKDTGRREKEFEDIFKKQYDQAEKDHPQMNVQEEIEKEYAEHRHIKFGVSTQNVGKQWDIPLIWRFFRCVDHSKSDFEIKCDKLIAKARVKVESVKHYDSSVVQEIIDLTEKTISDENITSKDKQNTIHYKIKELLQSEFKRIQDQWNDSDNIASKLLAAKLRLRNKFESVCEDFIETHAVVQDIVDSVKEALHLGFIEYLAEATKGIVEKKSWIGSSEVIQAHIDMHLLSLSKEERIQELIQEIMNSSDHCNKILSKLIMECVDSQGTWIRLVKQICSDIRHAASIASDSKINCHKIFQSEVDKRLKPCIKKHLPPQMWADMSAMENKVNWSDIANLLQQKLKKPLSKPPDNSSALVSFVVELLKREGIPDATPRCSIACPRCCMTCRLPATCLAESGIESKHDCKHQPRGTV